MTRRPVCDEEADGVTRMGCEEDLWSGEELAEPEEADRREPEEGDGAEDHTDLGRAEFLCEEEADEDGDRDGEDEGLERCRADGEALDRREDRHRRGDHPVAVEEGGAEEAEPDEDATAGALVGLLEEESEHRQHPALATVIGAHDVDDVLDAHDEEQRPEDEREDTVHVGGGRREAVLGLERRAERVERTRPDVAVDDAEGGEREDREPPPGGVGLDVVPLGRVILRRHRQRRPWGRRG